MLEIANFNATKFYHAFSFLCMGRLVVRMSRCLNLLFIAVLTLCHCCTVIDRFLSGTRIAKGLEYARNASTPNRVNR